MTELSIIIPAFNEESRILPTLNSFYTFLKLKGASFELIVVDDGSTDKTVALVKSFMVDKPEVHLLNSEENKGKGHAVRMGMLTARGLIRIFSDADGATPISELPKLLHPIKNGLADIAIGSRYLEDSNVNVPQPTYRRIWSRFSNLIVKNLVLPGIKDPHCGFKAFSRLSTIQIFSECTVNEWSFDIEALAIAKMDDFRILEVPVVWNNDERSKGKLRHLPKEMMNLYAIKKRLPNQGFSS